MIVHIEDPMGFQETYCGLDPMTVGNVPLSVYKISDDKVTGWCKECKRGADAALRRGNNDSHIHLTT